MGLIGEMSPNKQNKTFFFLQYQIIVLLGVARLFKWNNLPEICKDETLKVAPVSTKNGELLVCNQLNGICVEVKSHCCVISILTSPFDAMIWFSLSG